MFLEIASQLLRGSAFMIAHNLQDFWLKRIDGTVD